MIVRLEGTNKDEARAILQQTNLPIIFAENTNAAIDALIEKMEIND